VDLAEVVVDARHLEPVAVRPDHAPPGQVVERRAPEHGLLAACVHGDVAAHAGCVGRGGIDRKHETGAMRSLLDAARDDAGFGVQRRHRSSQPGSVCISMAPTRSSFSVLMTAANGVSGTALPV